MNPSDETVIELSKGKLFLLIVGSCAFVAAGVWMLSLDAEAVRAGRSFRFFFNNPLLVRALGLAAVLFFGFCAVYGVRKLFDRKPGLVLNDSGIVDNASGVAAGFIPWSEVVGAHVYEIYNQKMLIVEVASPQKYVDRGNPLSRALNKANSKMTGSPIAISSTALKINFPELLSLFDRYLQRYVAGSRGVAGRQP